MLTAGTKLLKSRDSNVLTAENSRKLVGMLSFPTYLPFGVISMMLSWIDSAQQSAHNLVESCTRVYPPEAIWNHVPLCLTWR